MRTLKALLRHVALHPALLNIAKNICAAARPPHIQDHVLAELTPYKVGKSPIETPRLNIVVPGISEQHVFGGIATALNLFEATGVRFKDLRIIVSDEQSAVVPKEKFYSDWFNVPLGAQDKAGNIITIAGDRYNKLIPIRKNDYFIATAWWTALAIKSFQKSQREIYGKAPRRFGYMIQDFEPGFYAWSARYALAMASYADPKRTIGIFNTSLLRNYFHDNGINFDDEYIFEPRLNDSLKKYLPLVSASQKNRKILIYGRPSVERNAFPLIKAGLERWSQDYPNSSLWEVISLGETHADIPLPGGGVIHSLGKVSINEYSEHLLTAAVGLSLMVSPHPSYPPLEMAVFGAAVITNRYKNKDLASLHPNIISVNDITPENLSKSLIEVCDKYESDSPKSINQNPSNFFFLQESAPFDFAPELAQRLMD